MARRFTAKPFEEAIEKAGKFGNFLRKFEKPIVCAISDYLSLIHNEDELHDLILLCLTFRTKYSGAYLKNVIYKEYSVKQAEAKKSDWINSSPRNISFNQCIGDSKTPVSEWLNVEDYNNNW